MQRTPHASCMKIAAHKMENLVREDVQNIHLSEHSMRYSLRVKAVCCGLVWLYAKYRTINTICMLEGSERRKFVSLIWIWIISETHPQFHHLMSTVVICFRFNIDGQRQEKYQEMSKTKNISSENHQSSNCEYTFPSRWDVHKIKWFSCCACVTSLSD